MSTPRDREAQLRATKDKLEQVKTDPTGTDQKDYLPDLLKASDQLWTEAGKEIVFSPAIISLGDTGIFYRGTVNFIQGKSGVHKSRLAETFCSLFLSDRSCQTDFLGFKKYVLGSGFYVAYIDTEREMKEQFPFSIQQIISRAGFDRTDRRRNFFPVSIKKVPRPDRLQAVKAWIEYVRGTMEERGVGEWPLFVVLDVVTDCVASFNRDDEAMALLDYLSNLCDDFGVTFLCVIHENYGTEKARGHVGTEGGNKSTTHLQIGFEKDGTGMETDLVKLKFMKIRYGARPAPMYLRYSQDAKGLIQAEPEFIQEITADRKKKADPDLVRELIEQLLDGREEIQQGDLLEEIANEFECSKNTAKSRIRSIVRSGNGLVGPDGNPARLVAQRERGRATVYRLEAINHTDDGTTENNVEIPF